MSSSLFVLLLHCENAFYNFWNNIKYFRATVLISSNHFQKNSAKRNSSSSSPDNQKAASSQKRRSTEPDENKNRNQSFVIYPNFSIWFSRYVTLKTKTSISIKTVNNHQAKRTLNIILQG